MFDYKNDPTLRALEGLLSTDDGFEPAEEGLKDVGAKFKGFVSGLIARASKNHLTKEEKAAVGNMKPQEAAQKYLATVSDMGSDQVVKEFIQWTKTEDGGRSGIQAKSFNFDGKTCALISVPTKVTNAAGVGTASNLVGIVGGFGRVANNTSVGSMTINLVYPGKSGAAPTMRTIDVYKAALRVAAADKKAANKAAKNPTADVAAASEALMNATTADEFLSAMEALTDSVDASISYAMESFTKENLDSALKAFADMVDEKCTTVTQCDAMASAIAGSSEKYNALLGAMKEGIEKADTGMIDKETLAKVLSTAGSELKALCNDCGLSGVSADNELSDEDITNLRALLLGAKQIVDQKSVALGGGSDEPTGPDGDPASESLFDGLISFGDPAEEGLRSWLKSRKEKKNAKKEDASEGDDDSDDGDDAEEGFKEWRAARKAKKDAKKAAKSQPAEESDIFTFDFDDANDGFGMESLFDMCLGDIAMEGDEGASNADATVTAVKKNILARMKEHRAQNKQIKSEVRSLDMLTLVKEYLTKKTGEGLTLGTGSLLRKLEDGLKESGIEVKEYRFNGKLTLICKDGQSDSLMYEVVTNAGKKAAVRTVFKEGLAKSVSKSRIKGSKANESLESLYDFLEDAQIATEANVCCADGNEATMLAQKKIAEMNFEIDDDGYTILINSPDEA